VPAPGDFDIEQRHLDEAKPLCDLAVYFFAASSQARNCT
jgi:hypothetical protein